MKGLQVSGKENPQGIPYEFVIIGDICRNTTIKMVNLTVYGYFTQAAQENGKSTVYTNTFTCQADKYDQYFDESILAQEGITDISQGYKYLVENEEFFEGAMPVY